MSHERRIRIEPGAPFGGRRHARRPRIAGSSGALPAALAAPDTWCLSAQEPLVFDADVCRYKGRSLCSPEDFWSVIRDDGLGHVEGSFALAWLTRAADGSDALHLARDPIGHRTLYYTQFEGQLLFSSSLYALQRVRRSLDIDVFAVAAYLSCAYVPGRNSIVEGVYELLPGERASFTHAELRCWQYWQLPPEPEHYASPEQLQAELRASLEAEITRLLPAASEPVAASLSGGIDSSLVVALAARLHPAGVRTFSLSFGDGYANELPFSSAVAAHCGTQHHVLELTPASVLAHLQDTMACLDKPNGDPLTVPNALLFRCMGEHATVALNGEGGDPCFGGPKNLPMILSELYTDVVSEKGDARARNYLRAHAKCFDELGNLLQLDVLRDADVAVLEAELSAWFDDPRYRSLLGRLMAINVAWKGGYHILPKIDALSAPFGVFPRSPLFNKAIVEAAFGVPSGLKLHGSVEKYLLKRAVADLLPKAIIDRPKSGMMVPVEAWFQGPLLAAARERILDGLAPYELFQRQQLERLVSGRAEGLRPRRGVKLWLLVTLQAHLAALRAASRPG